jgi:hypothetical protein
LKKLGLIKCRIIQEDHNKAIHIITLITSFFHLSNMLLSAHHIVIITQPVIINKNQDVNIKVITILVIHVISLGNAVSLSSFDIHLHTNGISVFNLIQSQLFPVSAKEKLIKKKVDDISHIDIIIFKNNFILGLF